MTKIVYNQHWMPSPDLAMLFMVEAPDKLMSKELLLERLPSRIQALIEEAQRDNEHPQEQIQEILGIDLAGEMSAKELTREILNSDQYQAWRQTFLHQPNNSQNQTPMSQQEAEELYRQTSLYQWIENLA